MLSGWTPPVRHKTICMCCKKNYITQNGHRTHTHRLIYCLGLDLFLYILIQNDIQKYIWDWFELQIHRIHSPLCSVKIGSVFSSNSGIFFSVSMHDFNAISFSIFVYFSLCLCMPKQTIEKKKRVEYRMNCINFNSLPLSERRRFYKKTNLTIWRPYFDSSIEYIILQFEDAIEIELKSIKLWPIEMFCLSFFHTFSHSTLTHTRYF